MIVVGLLFLIYFVIIAINTGLKSKFPIFWIIAGIILILSDPMMSFLQQIQVPILINYCSVLILFITLLCFLIAEILIMTYMFRQYKKVPNIIIVLGAQLNQNGPGSTLKRRLDLAFDASKKNPESIIVVSGGMGQNEPMTEAEGMRNYLTGKGLAQDRILSEEQSRDTYENLLYSKRVLEEKGLFLEKKEVGILTTDFHIYRAISLAKKAGYGRCVPMPAKCQIILLPNYLVREGLALIKDFLSKRL